MDTIWIIAGVLALVLVAGYFGVTYFKKHQIKKLFQQIKENVKQVPKSKKNSFILLMLVETMQASSKKSRTYSSKLNNPKYIEVQLIQMNKLLSGKATAEDKATKRAMALLKEYQAWEVENQEKKTA